MGNELYRHCLRDENKMTKFKDLGLKEEVLRGVTDQGFEEAFEIRLYCNFLDILDSYQF